MTNKTYYKIVKAQSRYKLEEIVMEHMIDGWQPIGGYVYIERDPEMDYCPLYSQTLIK